MENDAPRRNVAVSGEVIPPGRLSLPELVARVNQEHKQLKECVIKGAQHAVKAGELLWEAKRKTGHGRWLEWIAENCEFSDRTAQQIREPTLVVVQPQNERSSYHRIASAVFKGIQQR